MPGDAEVVEQLDAADPQHDRHQVGMTPPSGPGLDRPCAVLPPLPRDEEVHSFQRLPS